MSLSIPALIMLAAALSPANPNTPADSNAPAAGKTAPTVASLSADEAAAMVTGLLPKVEELRGMKFKHPVPVKVVDDAAAKTHFKTRMKKYWTESQMKAEEAAYTQLGLLPAGSDVESTLYSVLEEQAGGYYDPESDTFFVLGDMPRSIAPVLMVHELTHALDDQYFGIDGMFEKAMKDNDASAMVGAVVEGSGTLVMTRYLLGELQAGRMSPDVLTDLAGTDAGRAEKLMASPQVLQRGLIAPYVLGQTFILHGDLLRAALPTPVADIDRLFADPPVSTEQLLHPEKYWDPAKKDLPRPVALPDGAAILGEGWTMQGEGRLGELTLAVLAGAEPVDFKSVEAAMPARWTNAAASGWGGDAWRLYARANGQGSTQRVTLLTTLWDTPADAEEFEAALAKADGTGVSRRHWRRDATVVMVAGDAGQRADALAEAAFKTAEEGSGSAK